MSTNPTRDLAAYAAESRADDLASPVAQRARELWLDHLGVLLRGRQEPAGQAARRYLESQSGTGRSSVALEGRFPAAGAALANGVMAHAIELDDVTNESSLHPGVVVWPAAQALCERENRTVGDLLAAAVAGYEVTMRVGNALQAASTYARGFHPTGVAGAFGAAATAANVLGCDPGTLNHALGLAGSMAAGSLAYLQDGSDGKRLNAGWAAHGGVVAAELARAGLTGPSDVLAGALGALRAYSDEPDPAALEIAAGRRPLMLEVAIKPYACCRYIHPVIDACLALRELNGFEPHKLERLRVSVLPGGFALVTDPQEAKRQPAGRVDAQFSVYHGAAVALLAGDAQPERFDGASLRDPAIRGLAERVVAVHDGDLDARYPARWGCRAQARLTDGRTFEVTIDDPRGDRRRPLGRDQLQDKFLGLARAVVGARADAIAEWVLQADLATPVRDLTSIGA